VVEAIDPEAQTLRVRTDEDEEVDYEFTELDELVHAYAITVHRSQGSEYPAVVVPVTTSAWTMLQRNLLYTAVTRAKRLVVLVGSRKALAVADRTAGTGKRHTGLTHRREGELLLGRLERLGRLRLRGGGVDHPVLGPAVLAVRELRDRHHEGDQAAPDDEEPEGEDVVEAEFHDPLLLVIDAVPRAVSAVVGELERDVEVLALEQPDDLLEVVALLAGDAKLVALDLRFDALGALVADDLADLLRVLGADALLEGHVDLALLA